MQYRIASPADYGQLAHLYWTYASEENDSPEFDENAFTRRFHAFLKACMGVDYICWVAEEAGRIVSVVYIGMLEKMPSLSEERFAHRLCRKRLYLACFAQSGNRRRIDGYGSGLARTHSFETLFVLPGEKSVPFFERQAFSADNGIMGYSFRKD